MTRGHLSEIFASFQGEGLFAGQRHLFVRMSGCNLRCAYCDTPDSLEREPEYTAHLDPVAPQRGRNPIDSSLLARLVGSFLEADPAIDALSLTGGEPLMQASFLREFLTETAVGVPVLLETNGMLPQALAEVIDHIDIVSMDLKLPSDTGEPEFWTEHATFARLASRVRLYAKILVSNRSSRSDFERAVAVLAGAAPSTPTFVQPIVDSCGRVQIDPSRLTLFHAEARRSLRDVRVLPQVHKLLGIH